MNLSCAKYKNNHRSCLWQIKNWKSVCFSYFLWGVSIRNSSICVDVRLFSSFWQKINDEKIFFKKHFKYHESNSFPSLKKIYKLLLTIVFKCPVSIREILMWSSVLNRAEKLGSARMARRAEPSRGFPIGIIYIHWDNKKYVRTLGTFPHESKVKNRVFLGHFFRKNPKMCLWVHILRQKLY